MSRRLALPIIAVLVALTSACGEGRYIEYNPGPASVPPVTVTQSCDSPTG